MSWAECAPQAPKSSENRVGNAYRRGQSIGKGLFAKEDIKEGEEVVGMKVGKVVRYSERKWDKHHVEKGLPHDGAIFVTRIEQRITDWTDRRRMPRWYRLNHSKNPNLDMKYRKARVVWVANNDIPAGDELTFFYLEGTVDWD